MSKKVDEPTMASVGRLIPIDRWEEIHEWPSASGLRTLIYRAAHPEPGAAPNGAGAWVVRAGGRVLVDEAKFFSWARAQGSTPTPSKRGRKPKAAKAEAKAQPAAEVAR